MPALDKLNAISQPLQDTLTPSIRGDEDKVLPPVPDIAQRKINNNHNRIQNNLQLMLSNGASFADTNKYLRVIEGIDMGIDKEPEKTKESVSVGSIALSAARGSIRGTFGLAALPFLATDAIGFGIRKIWDETTNDGEGSITFDPTVSGKISEGGELLADLINPNTTFGIRDDPNEESAFINRAAEKIGEFIAPGGILVKGMTNQGARLASKSPEMLNWLQRAFVHAAKNPTKAQLYEAGLNAVAATSGEVAVSALTDNPADAEQAGWLRFGAEMTSVIGAVMAQRMGAKLFDLARNKLTLSTRAQELAAETKVGEILNEIMEADTDILRSIQSAEELEKAIPGLKLTTANVFQNPQVQAALQKVVQTGQPASATRYLRMLEAARVRVGSFVDEVKPIVESSDNLKTDLGTFMQGKFDDLDARVSAAETKAINEAELLHPERTPESIGQSGMEQMKILEAEAEEAVSVLYKSLDPDIQYTTAHIKRSLLLAESDPRFATLNAQRQLDNIAAGRNPKEGVVGLAGREFGDVPSIIVETGLANFGKDSGKVSLAAMMEWRRMVGTQQRLALIAGDTDTVARLDFLRKGIDRQFSAAGRRSPTGRAAAVFKEANEQWTQVRARFDQAYTRLGIQRDLNTVYRMAPEDFGRKFIRPEARAAAVQSAKLFKQIFGDTPSARALITDSIAYQLSKFKTVNAAGNTIIDMRSMQNWLSRYEPNLRAHGVWDQFKDVGNAAAHADRIGREAIVDRKAYERGILQAVIDAPNTSNYIKTQIRNGTLGQVGREIRESGNMPASRAWARDTFNTILDSADTNTLDTAENLVRKPDQILITIQKNEADLIEGLGRQHVDSLRTIGKALKLTEGTPPTFGARATEAATTPVMGQSQVGRALSKIRASLQGFVSPHFTLLQLANQGMDILSTRAAQNILEEAMYDWRYAAKLAQISKTRSGKEAMRLIGIQAVPLSIANFEEEDARTDFN